MVSINFAHPNKEDYSLLFAENKQAVIAVKEKGDSFSKRIRQEIAKIGIRDKIDRFDKIE